MNVDSDEPAFAAAWAHRASVRETWDVAVLYGLGRHAGAVARNCLGGRALSLGLVGLALWDAAPHRPAPTSTNVKLVVASTLLALSSRTLLVGG
jgi:hypothetical protein